MFKVYLDKVLFISLFVTLTTAGSGCDSHIDPIIFPDDQDTTNLYLNWGNETLLKIDKDLKIDGTDSYYENQERSYVSYIWGNIYLLYSFVEGVKLDSLVYLPHLNKVFTNCERHWHPSYQDIAGYSTSQTSANQIPDRYYDENGWMAYGLCDAYTVTRNVKFLNKAKEAAAFTLAGEDNVLGGGIYFKEHFGSLEEQKVTISCAVGILSYLKLYEVTGETKYLDDALRINSWVTSTLQDPSDHLFWDGQMTDDGEINYMKWSYNTGFMIRNWLLFFKLTNDNSYLQMAKESLNSAEQKWYNANTGLFNDPGYFAFTIVDCWFDLYDLTMEESYLQKAFNAVDSIHINLKDENGRYPEYWNTPVSAPLQEYDLRFSTVVAYIYFRAANYF